MSPGAAWPGAEGSRCAVPPHRVGPRLIGHHPLPPTVRALPFFQPLGRVDPQPPVLPPPAVIRWLGHAEAARDRRDRFPRREHPLRLPQVADDRLGRVPLACHADSLRTGPNPRTGSGPVLGGAGHYLYRAIDREGALLDSRRRAQRDTHAARRFLRRLVDVAQRKPERVTTDPHPPYRRAIRGIFGRTVRHRCNRYLNTLTEQSHRAVKQRSRPMLGFGSFASAARFCSAFDARRQAVRIGQRGAEWVPLAEQRRLVVQRWWSLIAEMTAA